MRGLGGGFFVLENKTHEKWPFLLGNRTRAKKRFFFARKVLPGIEPAPFLLRSESSQLRYVTLVVRRTALKLGSVRTSGRILFWFWPIHIFYRGKHVLILTISMQTWQFLLKRVWSAGAPRIFAPARTPQKPQIFGKGIFAVLLYNLQATTA